MDIRLFYGEHIINKELLIIIYSQANIKSVLIVLVHSSDLLPQFPIIHQVVEHFAAREIEVHLHL